MYFAALRRLIQSVEQTMFYDVSILYLTFQGYRDISVVDGSRDGGKDVISSRNDLRIQLSVRRDWENKINEEAERAKIVGLKHLIYVTNRFISPQAEADFFAKKYRFRGDVDVSIHDLNKISTGLARPGRINRAYEMMGASIGQFRQPTTAEIAISSVLLFGQEASQLREEIVEANVRAWLLHHPNSLEETLVHEVVNILPGADPFKSVKSAVSRLRATGHIVGSKASVTLSEEEEARMKSAEDEFRYARELDISHLEKVSGLQNHSAEELLKLATEGLLRGEDFNYGNVNAERVKAFIAENGLNSKRQAIYKALSECSIAKHFQYSNTIVNIFETNTFDIYRALGGRNKIELVLDTSVALPMLFGLEFQVTTSRYSVAATTLLEVCRSHELSIMVPRPYVNEMAAHGLKAIEFLNIYEVLPEDMKAILRGSGNAFLSHFSHIRLAMDEAGSTLTLEEFLQTFGLRKDVSIRNVENRIASLLETHGVRIGFDGRYDHDVRRQIAEKKSTYESKHVLDHDAAVCTHLIGQSEIGFIFATWDKVLIDFVQNLARVYADSPARVTDFLSAIEGIDYEFDHSSELLTTLLHVDERHVEKLAAKIEQIRSPAHAHKLRLFIDSARNVKGQTWMPEVDDLTHFLDSTRPDENSIDSESVA
jgi:Restriction endonuclease